MPLSTRRAVMGGSYSDRVLGYGPITYWPLDEISGTVAHCLVNPAQNGTYARDVATMTTGVGPDGDTAPNFDGTNDGISLGAGALTALNTVFNGALGSWAGWMRVSAVGVWTDATARYGLNCFGDANNYIRMNRHTNDNRFAYYRDAGAGVEYVFVNGIAYTTWMHGVITWNHAADEVKYYLNTALLETDGGLVAWNAAAIANVIIGAGTVGPITGGWSGMVARFALFDYVLTQSMVSDLGSV